MSRYSGVCDLFDHISGLGGYFDKDGNSVKYGEGTGPYYSDELKDFEAFKKSTGGVIYQHHNIEVNEYNQDFVKEHCQQFDIIKHENQITDKRSKTGYRTLTYFTYKYWGKEYTLKELNKKGVYVEIPIYFNTLLDLIPYYPYVSYGSSAEKSHIIVANESEVDYSFKLHLQNGWISELDYKGELQKHYLEVCKKYFLYKLEERTKIETINQHAIVNAYDSKGNAHYFYDLIHDVDYMHDIEFVWNDGLKHLHWTSPKLTEHVPFRVELSKEDVEYYLAEDIKNGTVKIKYVEKCEFPLEV